MTTETTMRAVVQHGYGSADTWRVERIGKPAVSGRKVLVRVHAAGLDRGTWHLMAGTPYLMRPVVGFRGLRQPVPGRDLAGTVVEVGPQVTRFAPGEEVYGIAGGTLAQFAAAHEDKLDHKPANLSFEQAAVVPISGLTAQQALDIGRVRSGQRVLVTGASGGVGSYLVQLAKAHGADVTGVSGPAKLNLVRFLGADRVLDYTTDDFADGPYRYDLIFDVAGNPSLERLRRALTPTGTVVIVGGEDGSAWLGGLTRPLRARLLSPFVRQRLTNFVSRERGLERLTEYLTAGTVTPCPDSSYPLDRAVEAMRRLDSGQVRGKVAITV
jgi:NADPH:quinone reductase-like Zn-dependent oxidoreductase